VNQYGKIKLRYTGYSKEELKIQAGFPPLPPLPYPPVLSFPPPVFPSFSSSSSPCTFFLPLEVGPLYSKHILVHFSLKIWHLVAIILMIFLRINCPKFHKRFFKDTHFDIIMHRLILMIHNLCVILHATIVYATVDHIINCQYAPNHLLITKGPTYNVIQKYKKYNKTQWHTMTNKKNFRPK